MLMNNNKQTIFNKQVRKNDLRLGKKADKDPFIQEFFDLETLIYENKRDEFECKLCNKKATLVRKSGAGMSSKGVKRLALKCYETFWAKFRWNQERFKIL